MKTSYTKTQLLMVLLVSLFVIATVGHLTWQEWATYAAPMRWFSITVLCFYSLTASTAAWKLYKMGGGSNA